ncbi:MAG: isopeptide-forming domain-containing fimbrial protein [Ginsengibacter sp.]
MKNFTQTAFSKKFCLALVSLAFVFSSVAQFRPYRIIYTDNSKGNIAMFGNTLMNIVDEGVVNVTKMNSNNGTGDGFFGNDNENMQLADIDGNTGIGSTTINSSSSDLSLENGSTIKFARLYWGGRVKAIDFDLDQPVNHKIKIRKGTTDPYTEFTALQIDRNDFIQNSEGYSRYQAFSDITSFIQSNGQGTYTVANAPLSVGLIDNGGNYGGWCIIVVYENPSFNYNSIRLYDGFEQVFDNGNPLTTTVTLTGLDVPSGNLSSSDAKMGVVTWEGDANLIGDFLKINGNTFSNAINQSYNPWNGTISNNGVFVTTKNPDYTNQMGIDIDQFEVGTGYGILPNDTTATLEFGTEADQYFPGIVSFVIRMKEPTITLEKTVIDANQNLNAEVNEVLTYTITGSNVGEGNAGNVVLVDTLPSTVTYVPNSLELVNSPGQVPGIKTDAPGDDAAEFTYIGSSEIIRFFLGTNANSSAGGTLAPGETYQVRFKVTVNDPGARKPVPAIINTARISATSDSHVNYVDDGTAILNPEGGALPVSLIYFTASFVPDRKAHISWSTSQEIDCKYYEVERSLDGNIFSSVATIPGNGTCCVQHNYSVVNDLSGVTNRLVYYRLSQVDVDGKKTYSKIIVLRITNEKQQLIISPNPFSQAIKMTLDWNRDEPALLKIIDASGKTVAERHLKMNRGTNYLKVDHLMKLLPGYYFAQVISDRQKISGKIVKE